MVEILGDLIFREPANDRVGNIEFSDAKNRLTDETCVDCLEGHRRHPPVDQFILQTIHLY